MAESKSDPSNFLSDEDVRGPNVVERAKEVFEPKEHIDKSDHHHHHHHHHKETHGLRDDIDENTPMSDVKAPNVFERVKEEIEAIVQAIHPKKQPKNHELNSNGSESRNGSSEAKSPQSPNSLSDSEDDSKAPNAIERAEEESEAIAHKEKSKHCHHKETHGRRDDIDENTPITEVKAPNVFKRAKEEIEAIVQAILPKKE